MDVLSLVEHVLTMSISLASTPTRPVVGGNELDIHMGIKKHVM